MNAILHFDGSYRQKEGDTCWIAQSGWSLLILSDPPVIAANKTEQKLVSSGSSEAEADGLFAGIHFVQNIRNVSKLLIVGDCQSVLDMLKQCDKVSMRAKRKSATQKRVRAAYAILKKWGVEWKCRKTDRFHNAYSHLLSRNGMPKTVGEVCEKSNELLSNFIGDL